MNWLMDKRSKIFVAGSETLIGAGLSRVLKKQGYENVYPADHEPCLNKKEEVDAFFRSIAPEYVFMAAGKSGGIAANQKYPAEFMLDNLLIECHVIDAAYRYGVKKLLYLASSCCYPRECRQPMGEDMLLTGPLETTNEPYAIAKIAGVKLVQSYRTQYKQNFICGIPANCYGPGDDFSPENSHVIGALLHRMHEARNLGLKEVNIWGTGKPHREFIYVDDLANACLFIIQNYKEFEPINIGPGEDHSIAEIAQKVQEVTDFQGNLIFDSSKPDGMPVKLLDTKRLKGLGWQSKFTLSQGLQRTYQWYKTHEAVSC